MDVIETVEIVVDLAYKFIAIGLIVFLVFRSGELERRLKNLEASNESESLPPLLPDPPPPADL